MKNNNKEHKNKKTIKKNVFTLTFICHLIRMKLTKWRRYLMEKGWLTNWLKEIGPFNILLAIAVAMNSASIFFYKMSQVEPQLNKLEARVATLENKFIVLETELKVSISRIDTGINTIQKDMEIIKEEMTRNALDHNRYSVNR